MRSQAGTVLLVNTIPERGEQRGTLAGYSNCLYWKSIAGDMSTGVVADNFCMSGKGLFIAKECLFMIVFII